MFRCEDTLRITHCLCSYTHTWAHTRLYDLIELNHVSLYTRRQHECGNGKSSSMEADPEPRRELFTSIEVCKFELTLLSIVAMSKGNAF